MPYPNDFSTSDGKKHLFQLKKSFDSLSIHLSGLRSCGDAERHGVAEQSMDLPVSDDR